MTIRVLVADDQPLMRAAFEMILRAEPDIELVGEASDGRDAVHLALRIRPDVVLMDVRMPLVDGVEATRELAARDGSPRINRANTARQTTPNRAIPALAMRARLRPCLLTPVGIPGSDVTRT